MVELKLLYPRHGCSSRGPKGSRFICQPGTHRKSIFQTPLLRFLYFYILYFRFLQKIYFCFQNLQKYTPAAPLRGSRGFCAKFFVKIFTRRSLGAGRPAAGRPAPGGPAAGPRGARRSAELRAERALPLQSCTLAFLPTLI